MSESTQTGTATRIATIETRVGGLERGIADLSAATTSQFAAMRQETNAALDKVTQAIGNLQGAMAKRAEAPWALILTGIGVAFSILVGIGTLAYSPIRNDLSKIETRVERTESQVVPRVEHSREWALRDRDLDKLEKRLDRLEGKVQ